MIVKRLFCEHPASVGETYGEHMRTALSFAVPLARASAAAFVHAVLPFAFVTTASRTVKGLNDRMTRRCKACPAGPAHRPDLFRPAPAKAEPSNPVGAWDYAI